jgi:hypothetical protein
VIFLNRLRAMTRLGSATLRVSERAFSRRVRGEDADRNLLFGDIEGQTKRAQAFAVELESSVLAVEITDPQTVTPRGWFGR